CYARVMRTVRAHVRLLAASWLLAQAVCLARPLCVNGDSLARLASPPKCADAAPAGSLCPMRKPDGTTCPMHRAAAGRTACTLTSSCSHTDEFLGTGTSPLAVPPGASTFPIEFAST